MFSGGLISDGVEDILLPPHCSLTTLFSVSTAGVTVHSASLSSSSSISVSLEFMSYKLLASLAGGHGEYFCAFTDSVPLRVCTEAHSHCNCFLLPVAGSQL